MGSPAGLGRGALESCWFKARLCYLLSAPYCVTLLTPLNPWSLSFLTCKVSALDYKNLD